MHSHKKSKHMMPFSLGIQAGTVHQKQSKPPKDTFKRDIKIISKVSTILKMCSRNQPGSCSKL